MLDAIHEDVLKCVRCGFCQDACPTYRLTGNEAESPRGRLYLMRAVVEDAMELDADVLAHLDSCLGCRACETACPSAVPYSSILERFRDHAERAGVRNGLNRAARLGLLTTLTHPSLFAGAMRLSRLGATVGIAADRLPAPLSRVLTDGASRGVALPAMSPRPRVGHLAAVSPAIGERRATVAVLPGCVMRVLFHETNAATVRVLQRNGCDVLAPPELACCGALHAHAGQLEAARSMARAVIDTMERYDYEVFVVNSAGCGSTMKEYGELLQDDRAYARRAAAFSSRVRDVSEFLDELGLRPPQGPFPAVVAYHDACHLAHGQGIVSAPRRLLEAIPGLRLTPLHESDTCCGSAGIYNLTQPEMAERLLRRKVDFIEQTGASVVAAANPGCIAWIKRGIEERGLAIRVLHPVEILDEAYAANG